jgi:hypothetical protein
MAGTNPELDQVVKSTLGCNILVSSSAGILSFQIDKIRESKIAFVGRNTKHECCTLKTNTGFKISSPKITCNGSENCIPFYTLFFLHSFFLINCPITLSISFYILYPQYK